MNTVVRPNMHTIALAAIVLTMWYGGAAQENGGAYILAFLVMGVVGVSLLHARANLRAVQINASPVPPTTAGTPARLPLTLTVGDGRTPCGIEITGPGVLQPVFIDKLSVDQPARVELSIKDAEAGTHRDLTVLVRSHYPLGFFTAQRTMTLSQSRLVLPKPEGSLPLPAPSAGVRDDGAATSSTGATGAGDDFAGVREWQAGDSLRHVDWKAVARERPMMVKLWSANSAGSVWLDWETLDLPTAKRIGQLAQWIEDAETKGLNYGLSLPGKMIQPANGADHKRRCLEALTALADANTHASTAKEDSNATWIVTGEAKEVLPGNPMRLLLVSLALTVLPMVTALPIAGSIAFFGAIAWRWWLLARGQRVVPMIPRMLTVIGGVFGIFAQTHTMLELEQGFATMLVVTGGKIMEARTPRDLQVIGLLGWFLCLCCISLEQSIGRSLWTYACFLSIAATLVRFRRGTAGLRVPIRTTGVLLMQSLPFVVLLFLFFPRGTAGMVVRISRGKLNRSGMSTTLNPGEIASLVRNNEVAFRVALDGRSFDDLPPNERYWRCVALLGCKGLKWGPGSFGDSPVSVKKNAPGFVQNILLPAHGGRWLPALDIPVKAESQTGEHSVSTDDNTLHSLSLVETMRGYSVRSQPNVESQPLKPAQTTSALMRPNDLPARVIALGERFKQQGTPVAIVKAALNYFRDEGFQYTLEPGQYNPQTGMEEFLFDRKKGFCEHYAATFATLMRVAGVPARVVMGYQGGQSSASGNYLIVRQSDAHAWTEVHYDDKWHRIDPTAALAPSRLTGDLRSAMGEAPGGFLDFARDTWLGRLTQTMDLALDQVNYVWYDRIVQFDEMKQTDLWRDFGMFRMNPLTLLSYGLAGLLIPLLPLIWWLRRRTHHPDPGVRLWMKFCDRLAKQGARREPNEGPVAFARRAAGLLPKHAQKIEDAANAYLSHRYGGSVSLQELRLALRQ